MLGKYKAMPVLAWIGVEAAEGESSQISRKSAHVDAPPGTSRYSFHCAARRIISINNSNHTNCAIAYPV